jgi:hypothetical protein
MKTLILIVLALLLSNSAIFGQNDRQNLEKYWYMRKQLKERFLRVGDKPGYNIPAGKIVSGPAWHEDPSATVLSRIQWGDGTIELGWYIAVLATEYKLLKDKNLPTEETAYELFMAIKTIDRLDQVAEKVWSYYDENDVPLCENLVTCGNDHFNHSIPDDWFYVQDNLAEVPYNSITDTWDPGNTSTTLNGFFIRDDVPHNILEDFDFPFTSMSSSMARPKDAQYSYLAPDEYIHNNYMSNSPPANEMSQDQVFNLLIGLTLTKEYCSNLTYTGNNVGDYASTIALRLLNYYNGSWIIKNPERDKQVLIGGNSAWFSPSLTRLKNYFIDGSKHYNAVQGLLIDNPCNGSVNLALSAIITSISNSTTQLALDDMVDGNTEWELYILLNNTLYGHSNDNYKLVDIKEDLNLCPCRGPYLENILWTPDYTYMTNGYWTKIWPDGLPSKWNRGNRFKTAACEPIDNNHVVIVNGEPAERWFSEQYNGLDYMLLYNLYRINYDYQDNFPYTDMRNAIVTGVLPDGTEGTVNNFRTYNSFGALSTDIKMTAPVDNLPAGALMYAKSIKFKPGFQVKAGARLVAQIHPDDMYECWSGTYRIASNTVDIPENMFLDNSEYEGTKQLIVFPNPATNFAHIEGIDCIQSVSIITNTGVSIRQIKGVSNKIDLSGISDGSYFLRIIDCGSKEYFVKLLVSQ